MVPIGTIQIAGIALEIISEYRYSAAMVVAR
jgi:hypothetical protein